MTVVDSRHRSSGRVRCVWALVICVSACGGDELVQPLGAETGRWTLATIDAVSLPVVIGQTQVGKTEVISGSIALDIGGTFTDVVTTKITTAGTSLVIADTVIGSWSRSRNSIVCNPESDDMYQLELGAASLTAIRSSRTWIYAR